MKILSTVYNAYLWALTAAALCYTSQWLQMRVNVGYVFFALFAVLVATTLVALRKRQPLGWRFTLANLITCSVVGLVAFGVRRMQVVPASLVREGLGMPRLPFATVNGVLAAVTVVGIVLVVALGVRWERRSCRPPLTDARRTSEAVRWATFLAAAAVVALFACVPSLRAWVGSVFAALGSGDIERVVDLIRSYGPWAAAVSFVLMVLQSLAAPIPAFLITFANAAVFGWWQGALLSWASAMAGAAVCFWLARAVGRDAVEGLASHTALASVDRFFERYGDRAILVCRLLPFMSFDIVSYAAGLTGMRFWGFLLATGVGQLPATVVYSYVGGMLTGGARLLMTALLAIFALFALGWLVKAVFANRHRDLMEGAAAEGGVPGGPASAGAGAAAGEPPAAGEDGAR